MARFVTIVFDSDFADRLEKLSFRCPVWMVDTAANVTAAERAWSMLAEWPQISVTMFQAPSNTMSGEEWHRLLEHVAFRERAIETIEVIGAALTPSARVAFADEGLEHFSETDDGFKASKRRATVSMRR